MTDAAPVDPPSLAKPAPSRSRLALIFSWRALPPLVVLVCAGFAIWLCAFFVQRAGDAAHPLTQLEQALFGLFTLLAGAGLSWLTSAYYSAQQARSQFQQLARPALRRVTTARDSADALLVAIDRRRTGGPQSQHDPQEHLASLYELVEQHARVLDDAIEDWHEVLPEDVQAVHAQEARRSYLLLNTRLDDVNAKLTLMAAAIDGKTNTASIAEEIADLRAEVANLRKTARVNNGGHIAPDGSFITPRDPGKRRVSDTRTLRVKTGSEEMVRRLLDDVGQTRIGEVRKEMKSEDGPDAAAG
ncbi:hypothetical protein ABIH81_11190 [Micromonospora sp. HUAS YX12]|uniref:Uncharacterized protein n=1 Tax=Micromonospora sp. HUAS YX12 TaxID=3156396 RepID=A0AAU7R6U9_9ACTN